MYDKFYKLMLLRGVKPADVAKATGVAPATLSSWRSGAYEPKVGTLQKIADYFNVSICYFFDDQPESVSEYTEDEIVIIDKYRRADDLTKDMVRRILGVI